MILSTKKVSEFQNLAVGTIMFLLYLRLIAGAMPPGLLQNLPALITSALLCLTALFTLLSGHVRRLQFAFPLIGMIYVSIFSFIFSEIVVEQDAYLFIIRIILLLVWILFCGIYFTNSQGFRALALWVRFSIIFSCLLAIMQVILAPHIYSIRGETRAFGMMGHPVAFSMYLFLALIFLEFVRAKLGSQRKIIDYITLLFGVIALILTQSQTAWFMLFIFILGMIILRLSVILKIVIIPVLVLTTLTVLYSLPFTRDVFSFLSLLRKFDEIPVDHYAYWLVEDSVSWRVVNWKISVWEVLPQWYLGLGPGQAEHFNQFGLTMHSLPLEIFVEIGAFGLLFLIVLIWLTWKVLSKKPTDDRRDSDARKIAQCAGIATLAAGTLSVTLVDQAIYLLLFFAMVIIADTPSKAM